MKKLFLLLPLLLCVSCSKGGHWQEACDLSQLVPGTQELEYTPCAGCLCLNDVRQDVEHEKYVFFRDLNIAVGNHYHYIVYVR